MDPGVTRGNEVDPCGSPISLEERLGTTVNRCKIVDWWLPTVIRGKIRKVKR